jgi:spore germination cell wall hydrolase CwlJ-like protein
MQLTTTTTKPIIKTTETQSTTTATTTESTTTTKMPAEVTTAEVIPATEAVTDLIEVQPVIESALPISEQDRILIGNVISHEAGSAWISEYERVCIVAAIMNRVTDSRFPDTVDGVLHQSGQFFDVPYCRVDYSGIGFEPIDRAIDAYFNGEYNCGNINSWSGDGSHNYFYHQ